MTVCRVEIRLGRRAAGAASLRLGMSVLAAWALPNSVAAEQARSGPSVVVLDPVLHGIVAPDSHLQTLYQRDTIFEGPTWFGRGRSGYLSFTDVPGNAIDRMNQAGRVTPLVSDIFRGDPAEAFQTTGQRKFTMVGANGATRDSQGRIVYCGFSDGEIVRVEADGRRTVLARSFAGRRLNAPNDLVYAPDGSLYFTDSRAGTKRADGEGVPYKALYRLKGGEVQLVSRDIDHPNGLAFSPDGKQLYVTNTLQKNILRFDVGPAGIANAQVFIDMHDAPGAGGPDGIKIDRRGFVYSTGPGGLWIVSPAGKHVGTILTPTVLTNLVFGGPDFRSLYMTANGAIYRIRLKLPGR